MDHRESIFRGVTVALTVFALTTNVAAQEFSYDKEGVEKGLKDRGYSPYAGRNFPTRVYFGDTHLHTAISEDAFDGLREDVRQRVEELLAGIDPDLGDISDRVDELIDALRPLIEDRVEQFLGELAERLGLSELQLQLLLRTLRNMIEDRLGGGSG